MTITKTIENGNPVIALEGRLDTNTAPQLEAAFAETEKCDLLTLDFEKLEYISSAGLRVLLSRQKAASALGNMVLRNVCEDIMEVFDITGFTDILTIEK